MSGSPAQRKLLAAYYFLDFLWEQYNLGGWGRWSWKSNCVIGNRKGDSPETYKTAFALTVVNCISCDALLLLPFKSEVRLLGSQVKLWVPLQLVYCTALEMA